MLLFRTSLGAVVQDRGRNFLAGDADFDALLNSPNLHAALTAAVARGQAAPSALTPLAPIGTQEVWAAGVTYWRSRTARMEESKVAGGGSFYDRVYEADRPELFFKSAAHRVVGPGGPMRLRKDSKWMVPEPELTLAINARGEIIGYTIGNDLSCRDIEGENPLYLPQAKTFDGCAALGPAILVTNEPLRPETKIALEILREGSAVFVGDTAVSQLRRTPASLVEYLFRELSFPTGAFLMTGTGIVPPDQFTLRPGDEMRITIESIGTLSNTIAP